MTTQPLSVIQRAALLAFESRAFPRGARVLDAPCGDGGLVSELARLGCDAHGVDIDTGASGALGPAFRQGDLNGPLPYAAASFDVVFSIEGIEHLENRFGYLREIHRVLK